MKNVRAFHLKFLVFGGEIFSIFEYACFRNGHEKRHLLDTWFKLPWSLLSRVLNTGLIFGQMGIFKGRVKVPQEVFFWPGFDTLNYFLIRYITE